MHKKEAIYSEMPFIDLCLRGEADLSEIDDYVEKWHLSKDDIPIYEFLGMTREEYALWVEKPQTLRSILFAHKHGISLKQAISQEAESSMAARAANAHEAKEVLKWLKKTGRIS